MKTKIKTKMPTCLEIESLIARKWGIRQNIIVPNVHWGLGLHECDLLIVSKSNWATEVEIKVSKSDLKKDASKGHQHKSKRIKYLYFAIPEKLENCIELIPAHAGIIIVRRTSHIQPQYQNHFYIEVTREPQRNELSVKLTDEEVKQVARLGCMRIWGLKTNIISLINDNRYWRNKEPNVKESDTTGDDSKENAGKQK